MRIAMSLAPPREVKFVPFVTSLKVQVRLNLTFQFTCTCSLTTFPPLTKRLNTPFMSHHEIPTTSDKMSEAADTVSKGTVIEQDSPFLRLPGELRNRIYGLSMPESIILVRAERRITTKGKSIYRFFPGLPALMSVCREMRQEFPLNTYFGKRTVLLTDGMFGPSEIFSRVIDIRGQAAEIISKAKVNMVATLRDGRELQPLRIRFTTHSASDAGIVISDLATSGPNVRHFAATSFGMYCC